ncbi:alpha/beta hydrolase family protein [Nonomuraea ferruginea]
MLTVHAQDEFVPPQQSELVKDALGKLGVPVKIITVPGQSHSTTLYREMGVAERVQAWIASRIG